MRYSARHTPTRRQSFLPAMLGLAAVVIFAAEAARAETRPAPGSTVPIEIKTCDECSTDYDTCVAQGNGL